MSADILNFPILNLNVADYVKQSPETLEAYEKVYEWDTWFHNVLLQGTYNIAALDLTEEEKKQLDDFISLTVKIYRRFQELKFIKVTPAEYKLKDLEFKKITN